MFHKFFTKQPQITFSETDQNRLSTRRETLKRLRQPQQTSSHGWALSKASRGRWRGRDPSTLTISSQNGYKSHNSGDTVVGPSRPLTCTGRLHGPSDAACIVLCAETEDLPASRAALSPQTPKGAQKVTKTSQKRNKTNSLRDSLTFAVVPS